MFTHMPFLHPDGMIFAAAPEVQIDAPARWKIHVAQDGGIGARLETGLPADMIECSPALARLPDGLVLTFIGQREGDYRFYQMAGPDLAGLSPARPAEILGRSGAHAGTVSGAFEAVDRPEVAGIEASAFKQPAFVIPYARFRLEEVARIAFEFDRPWRMLVSGRSGGEWHTVVHDFKTGEIARIRLTDGRGVYKASIAGGRLAYAERLSESFEARAIRFVEGDGWTLEPLEAGSAPSPTGGAVFKSAVFMERERCLRANCAVGRYCQACRNHRGIRDDLETIGLVDRDGNGCPRGLAWDAPPAALAAVRPGATRTPPVWCERFMVGTTPAYCQQCVAIRTGGDPDAAARWLQRLAGRGRGMACVSRIKTDARRMQECCGRAEKEIAVYRCAVRDMEVEPDDCRNCAARSATGTVLITTGNRESGPGMDDAGSTEQVHSRSSGVCDDIPRR
jgi:hypothetical protein